jgi:hypothetical protein
MSPGQSLPPTPAWAYWSQRHALHDLSDRLAALEAAVNSPTNLSPNQWAQLLALALEFRPTLILELGRGLGNSTCVFTEAANRLPAGSCRVLSLCFTDGWQAQTKPRVRAIVPPGWFSPLEARIADILTCDYQSVVRPQDRVLVFWDAHGFEIAECVLGGILPLLADKPHVVAMHDLSDARHLPAELARYEGRRIWMGARSMGTGARLRLGHIDSEVPQALSVLDFCSRNRLTLESADHGFHEEIGAQPARAEELRRLLGERHFSLTGHWFWFSLNERPGPYTFPAFTRPPRSAWPKRAILRRLLARLLQR